MQVRTLLRAAGLSDPGRIRDHNEDRFHFDAERGIFIVVDGVGGQAAGEKAAETALARIRQRLEVETGAVDTRIREAITAANQEVLRLSRLRPEWDGMACVLTVVVVDGPHAVVGHVGDTRLYKIRAGRIEKLTRDHSPVGEREDAGELSEAEAMRHPRRHEVYRDVGSEEHRLDDPEFIDTFRIALEPDAALLLCSDGLSDLVSADTIRQRVEAYAGHPYEVARALVEAANDAGGKDNVTVVYVEGARFAEGEDTGAVRGARRAGAGQVEPRPAAAPQPPRADRALRLGAIIVLIGAVLAGAAYQTGDFVPAPPSVGVPAAPKPVIVVGPGESISAAIASARPGTVIIVEPGEYREQLRLRTGTQLRSRVPRAATLRLPVTSPEGEAAIIAEEVADADVRGFRIIGDAASPLGTGIRMSQSALTLADIEVRGARTSAIVFGPGSSGALLASELVDNPGLALDVRAGAQPRIAANTFARNAAGRTILIEPGAQPDIRRNTFVGVAREALMAPGTLGASIAAENYFVPAPRQTGATGRSPRQGR